MISKLRIATRKSPLALWQAHFVAEQLQNHHPLLTIELVPIETQGDKILDTPLAKIGGKGLFVKQLETALLNNEADIAVHSVKDIPMNFPNGLTLTTVCQRDDARDAFVSNEFSSLSELPFGSIVGTSSLRRQCQLRALYSHLQIKDLRGNVGTRLEKLDNGQYDAIILAVAGLKRLNYSSRITQFLSMEQMLPAVGQAAIGIESRIDDDKINTLLAPLEHHPTRICITAERAMNKQLEGGCQVPIACHAFIYSNLLRIRALVGDPQGAHTIYYECQGSIANPDNLGQQLANKLCQHGADKILQQLYHNG